MVGRRIHGMAQRRECAAALSGALSASPSRGSRLLRPEATGGARGASRPCPTAWHPRVLLLPLLVQRQAHSGATVRRGSRVGQARLSVLSLLGERELDTGLGWGRGELAVEIGR